MDTRQLRIFLAVAEYKSFSKAASAVFLTQSGVSYQIALLESTLGVRLLHRGPREVQLTESGLYCYKKIKKMLQDYDQMAVFARQIETEAKGRLAIGVHGGCEVTLLPEWVERLNREYPGIKVHLNHCKIDTILSLVRNRKVDIGFTLFFDGERNPTYNCRTIMKDPMVVAMSRYHPLAQRKALSLQDLAGQPFLYLNPLKKGIGGRGFEWRQKLCRRRGFEMEVVQTFPTLSALFLAVESGVGIAIFGAHSVEANSSRNIHCIPLVDEDCCYEHGLIWDRHNDNPNIGHFLDINGLGE